jgi:hypothetical protein
VTKHGQAFDALIARLNVSYASLNARGTRSSIHEPTFGRKLESD